MKVLQLFSIRTLNKLLNKKENNLQVGIGYFLEGFHLYNFTLLIMAMLFMPGNIQVTRILSYSHGSLKKRFHHANIIDYTYTHTQMVQPTTHLGCVVQPIAPGLRGCTTCYCTKHKVSQAQEKMTQSRDTVNTRCMRLLPV